jgi:hypothetical protein
MFVEAFVPLVSCGLGFAAGAMLLVTFAVSQVIRFHCTSGFPLAGRSVLLLW